MVRTRDIFHSQVKFLVGNGINIRFLTDWWCGEEIINIWVMQNYEDEVWELKYQLKLPVADIKGRFEGYDEYCYVNVAFGRWSCVFVGQRGPVGASH